jgi:CRISPR system Cascade subunit CasD
MAVLLLRLAGPMQSWGTGSFSSHRDTGREPSFSGVAGLCAAALGRGSWATVDDLAALQMAARADRPGRLECDFQVAQNVLTAGGGVKPVEPSHRYYLSDASFLAALQGDKYLLRMVHEALRRPRWALYLGRRSYVPGEPVWLPDGLREGDDDVLAVLSTYPWRRRWPAEPPPERLRVVLQDPQGDAVRYDVPAGKLGDRQFRPRRVRTVWLPWEETKCTSVN